ncbi:MAG: hypothetical protein CML56_01145 [Rhodobacteraceae bacterium]|nr:hypothetical protein [Paracoccaceae bacterium]|tara:strand:+ start:170 stop:370 length:201 start_codon:yes stop_codon:yes gene_type:complete
MKIGDLVEIWTTETELGRLANHQLINPKGVIVGFNKKGDGGKDYVHVLIDGKVSVFMRFAIEVIND